MDSRRKAHALADLGMAVFPLGRNKKPVLPKDYDGGARGGFYHGTTDHERIDQLWDAAGRSAGGVGVWAGASGVVCVDIDIHVNERTGEVSNGFETLKRLGWEYASPVHYGTASGGEHHLFRCPDGHPDNGHLPGVDIKGGASYWVHYGPVPTREEWDSLPEPPEWVPRGERVTTVAETVDVDEMLDWLQERQGGTWGTYLPYPGGHYGDLNKPLARLFWHVFNTPGITGGYDGLQRIIRRYENSPDTSIPVEERERKVLELAAWFFGIYRAEAASN